MTSDPVGTDSGSPEASTRIRDHLARLRAWNLGLAALHAVQAVLIIVLSGDFAISVVSLGAGADEPAGPHDHDDVALLVRHDRWHRPLATSS